LNPLTHPLNTALPLSEFHFTSGTDLMSLFISLLYFLGRPPQKSATLRRYKSIGMKSLRVFLQANPYPIFHLTSPFQDGGHDVILCKKCYHLVSDHKASGQRQFLICSTYVLVRFFIFWLSAKNLAIVQKITLPARVRGPEGQGAAAAPPLRLVRPCTCGNISMHRTIELTDVRVQVRGPI